MKKTPQNRYSITPKGRVYLAAVETGLIENTDENMMKFEAFWERLETQGVSVLEKGDEQARKRHDTIIDIVRHILFALLCLLAGLLGRGLRL